MAAIHPSPPAPFDEAQVVRRAQRGDREAQSFLVERYWDRLYRWLFHLTRDRHRAEDLAQDSFVKALANLDGFQPGTNFGAWLFRIGHNAFVNLCRNAGRGKPLPDDLPAAESDPAVLAESNEGLQRLGQALHQLPEEFRAALLLRAEEGLSFREIASILGLTEETARWRVFKARKQMLALLAPQQEQETP